MHVSSPFQTSSSAPLATSTNVSTTNKSFAMYSHRNDYLPSTNCRFGWFQFSSWQVGPWPNDYWRTLYMYTCSVCSKSEFSSRVCLRSPLVLLRKSIEHHGQENSSKSGHVLHSKCDQPHVHCCFAKDMYRTPKYHLIHVYWQRMGGKVHTEGHKVYWSVNYCQVLPSLNMLLL